MDSPIDMSDAFGEIDARLVGLKYIQRLDEFKGGSRTGRCRTYIKSERFRDWAIAVIARSQGKSVEVVKEWYNSLEEHRRYNQIKSRLPDRAVLPLVWTLRMESEGNGTTVEAREFDPPQNLLEMMVGKSNLPPS